MRRATFVIATYGRPDVLRCTLESLILQSNAGWEAIVVGDCCDAQTEAAIRSTGDERIAYYNLPERFGEQSGPNSVGLALAKGEYVAFLNHDDLLLIDHLAYGLGRLEGEGGDFFLGMAANATQVEDGLPVFTDLLPRSSDLRRLLVPPLYAFDPSSFWLIKTAFARRVGSWRSAQSLWRTPLDDWLLRAWKAGGSFVFGERVTGLRFRTHYQKVGLLYEGSSSEHRRMLDRIANQPPDVLRYSVQRQIEAHGGTTRVERHRIARSALATLYRRTGIDAIAVLSRFRGRRGAVLQRISKRRTGAALPSPPNLEELIANAELYRVI